jgi:CRP-like cAMP-binding protein
MDDADAALEWCENELLRTHLNREVRFPRLLEDFMLCEGLAPNLLEQLEVLLHPVEFEPGHVICREGEDSDALYFVDSGDVSVYLRKGRNGRQRVAAFASGSVFGERALLGTEPRTADVVADTRVSCRVLETTRLDMEDPATALLRHELIANMANLLVAKLRNANDEIRRLGG